MTAFAYRPRRGRVIAVPTHPNRLAQSTDLASVPPLLWGLLASYGRQLRAALVHDRLCDLVNHEPDPRRAQRQRRRADDIFREAMRDPGNGSAEDSNDRVGWFRSWLLWAGVSYGRYWRFWRLRAALLAVHVLVGVLAVDLAAGLPLLHLVHAPQPWDNAALLRVWALALLLSLAWFRDWRMPLIGLLTGPLIVPVLFVTFVAQIVLGFPDWLLHLVSPSREPGGNFGPTIARMHRPKR